MKVIHKQIYRQSCFGGEVNTTLCGREEVKTCKTCNDGCPDTNKTDINALVTCKICKKLLALNLNFKGDFRSKQNDRS